MKKLEDASSSRAVWLGPSADEMGCVLAQNAYDAGSRRVAVVYDAFAVSGAMAKEIEATLVRYFSTSKAEVQLISISDGLGSVVPRFGAPNPCLDSKRATGGARRSHCRGCRCS